MNSLFTKDTYQLSIQTYKYILERMNVSQESDGIINKFILDIMNDMYENKDRWDRSCQVSIKMIGDKFIDKINLSNPSNNDIEDVFFYCYNFTVEYILSNENDFGDTVFEIYDKLDYHIKQFDGRIQNRIQHIKESMPILFLKKILYSNDLTAINDFIDASKNAVNLKNEWDAEVEKKRKEILDIKKSLEDYKTGFNFVGLYEGFNELHEEKVKEKNNILFWMRILSGLIVLPILFELMYIYTYSSDFERTKMLIILSFLPTISLLGICIYYFRILLVNYKSVKSQILQLDLRKTLCRFIQHYVTYAKEINNKDPQLLNKFENIIFSGIVADNEKLPSTFDGIEQLSNLIKSVK
ncbi:TPA: hypothetical protein ACMDOH_002303 [Vibrio cholerae]|nr:hypothetical protein [Vibrio cholerae]EGR4283363.1 hypothetical protein [Vibrio cholerae]